MITHKQTHALILSRSMKTFFTDIALRLCRTVSIYNITYDLRLHIINTMYVYISLNEIMVLFPHCTIQEGAKSE